MKAFYYTVLIIGFVVGLLSGYILGDFILSKITLVTVEDWFRCRIGFPLVLGIPSYLLTSTALEKYEP